MNCVLFACYLPSLEKVDVVQEILGTIKYKEGEGTTVFIGIQNNSIPETEAIIKRIAWPLKIEITRVRDDLAIDSDASAFMAALDLYRKSSAPFNLCYFVHTKSITTGADHLRTHLLALLFNTKTITEKLSNENVGSYGPFITLIQESKQLSCLKRFTKKNTFTVPPMGYFYPHTFFVIKNKILKRYVLGIDSRIFNTPIGLYSDRYLFERDFPHIVDMMGYEPSYSMTHGNHETKYQAPTDEEVAIKLKEWKVMKNGIKRTVAKIEDLWHSANRMGI